MTRSFLHHERGPLALLALLGGLVLLSFVCLAMERGSAQQSHAAGEFQRLVGGLGMGPAIDLSRCPYAFDPRLDCACRHMHGPLPGGQEFCAHHTGAVLPLPLVGP